MSRFAALKAQPLHELGVLGARAAVRSSVVLQGAAENVEWVRDLTVPGPGGAVPVRVYHPQPGRALPLLVYLHGGGWTTGGLDVSDRPCRSLALATGCVVGSVDFRLSPESPYPGALEDSLVALDWLAERRGDIGADPDSLVLIGDSSGANLAAAATLAVRDRGGPRITGQVLLYPALAPSPGLRAEDPDGGHGTGLTWAEMDWFWSNYLPDASFASDPLAAPLHAPNLSGLPPALVVTAEYDILRAGGRAYAQRLSAAEVQVTEIELAGMIHGFLWMLGALPSARSVLADIGRFVNGLAQT